MSPAPKMLPADATKYEAKTLASTKRDSLPKVVKDAIARCEAEVERQEAAIEEAVGLGPAPDGWNVEEKGSWPGMTQEEADRAYEYGVLAFEFVQPDDLSVLVVLKEADQPLRIEHYPNWPQTRLHFRVRPGSEKLTDPLPDEG